ncbi:hypothetical protein [Bacillus sp. RHFS10]|uniref:hypothetical protein n=1 Tax=Bacillus sp. RHFS10 TaxID=2804501 RepID=UPI001929344B|nr:hypothetical protein [Bacillus sp. RHFS10]MBL3647435.1 hypothetical protein [Bacillus sp. RHFS10]
MSKNTFNITDLTKEVYGDEDTNSSVFESNRKRVGSHINKVRKMLGHPTKRFEAPIEQLDAYVKLIRNMLENPKNEEALDLLNKKLVKGKTLQQETDEKALTTLIEILAEIESQKLTDEDNKLFGDWLQDQMSDDYYLESEKNINEVMRIVKSDFSLFDDLNSLKSKLEFQEQYMNDLRTLSALYRQQVEQQLLFQESFLEVVNSYPHLNKKKMYTTADFLELPPSIQQEIQELIEQKQQKPSER